MDKTNKIILVTGATGHQGGAVTRHLLSDGWKVRIITRNPNKPEALELKNLGVEVFEGDLDIPATLDQPLEGVYGVFSVQNPWEHGVDDEVSQGIALADLAKESGVQHFVYSSVGSADQKTGIPHFESKYQIEEHIRNLGINFTIVRPVWFMENLLTNEMTNEIYSGSLGLALNPDITLQMIAVDDIGAFVAVVFDHPEDFIGKAMDIAGDELTGLEMAEILSRAVGREVKFKEVQIEQLRSFSSDYAMMFDWFNLRGYNADIDSVRDAIPELQTFDNWVGRSGWHRAAA